MYNDDNIVSKIDISSTELYSLYNAVEVEFSDSTRKDQQNTVLVETPNSDRNPNEPDNVLQYKLDLVNDNMRAETLANIDLNQSRVGTVIQFNTDFSGMQTDVGDVIKVTSDLYGFDNKLFRVMRCTEVQTPEGMVTVQMSCIEYSDDYYVQANIRQTPADLPIDIPKLPIIGPIYLPQIYAGTYGNVSALPGGTFGNVIVNDVMKTFGAGTQLADNPAFNAMVSGTTFNNVMTPETYEIDGADLGDYELTAVSQLTGLVNATYDFGLRANADVVWANATATHTQSISQEMNFVGLPDDAVPPPVSLAKKMNLTVAGSGGAASDMNPANVTITMQGYSDIGSSGGFTRGMSNMGYQFLRVTKGER